mmetsp:Transcript_15655/g.24356  ORF Transcript_15655/g.24356 Transcript_15655/m.24356 type:complete len:84 (+) Transcript_15655:132-383(+)
MALSKTNTDSLCCDTTSKNVFVRWMELAVYRFNLWTGLYMLERHERFLINCLVLLCVGASCLYLGVLSLGFYNGFMGFEDLPQ